MKFCSTSILACSLLALAATAAGAQASAPATASTVSNTMPTPNFGFSLPTRLGSLSYALNASELVETGYRHGSTSTSTVGSGNLAYLSNSERNPFSTVISAGYFLNAGSGGTSSSGFANLAASQVLRTRSWVFVVSDALSYLPQSPTTGLSGLPGLGDLGNLPVQTGLGPEQSILTVSGERVSNGLSGSATWQLTSKTDLQGSASWQLFRFVGDVPPGFNTDGYAASFGPDHRIDARNSVSASAYYSRQVYPDFANSRVETEGVNFGYTRAWTRALSTTVTIGPETTHGQTYIRIPARLDVAVAASLSYAGRLNGLNVGYTRAVNGGSGVIFGATSDTVAGGFSHPFSREWLFGLNASYSHSVGLTPILGQVPRTSTVYGGAQLSRRLSESLSVYASYTAVQQSASGFSGLSQLFGFATPFDGFNNIGAVGISFAPPPLNRGR